MAHHLKGDLREEVSHESLFSRSPPTDPRYGPARGGFLAPDRSSVPGQPFFRHPAVAALPQHRLARTQTPWRREPSGTRAGGLGAAPGIGPTAARCHARGIAPAAGRLLQPHDHLARPAPAEVAAQEEGPSRPGAGPPGGPGEKGRNSARSWPAWTRAGWSSWTSAEPTRR